jgi:hypothetical protein
LVGGEVTGDWQPTFDVPVCMVPPGRRPGGRSVFPDSLPANPEPEDELPVALDVVAGNVVEQPTPATDELHQPSAGVMVARMHLQMISEVRDPVGEKSYLDLRRTRV